MPVPPTTAAILSHAPSSAQQPSSRQAAEQFEAMMIERLLAAARPQTTGPAADWRAMADRKVAEDLARNAPLGLVKLIEDATK